MAFALLTQQPQVRLSTFPKVFLVVAEIYGRPCLEASGQRLDNDNQTHLLLASGKLLLQKIMI